MLAVKLPKLEFRFIFKSHSTIRFMSTHLERTAQNSRQQSSSSAHITDIVQLSSTVKQFTLQIANPSLEFYAGQWVDFFIPGITIVGGYSMCSSPQLLTQRRLLQLAVKYSQHPPAHWLHTKATRGDEVSLRVGGDFYYSPALVPTDAHLLLVAGGVGINPLFSILQAACALQSAITLLYSASARSDLIFHKDICAIASNHTNINCHFHITSEQGVEKSIAEMAYPSLQNVVYKVGRIDGSVLSSVLQPYAIDTAVCYLCGPPTMTDVLLGHLKTLGLHSDQQISYEKWW